MSLEAPKPGRIHPDRAERARTDSATSPPYASSAVSDHEHEPTEVESYTIQNLTSLVMDGHGMLNRDAALL